MFLNGRKELRTALYKRRLSVRQWRKGKKERQGLNYGLGSANKSGEGILG